MKDVNPTYPRPRNSTQQQIPNEPNYMPLQGMSPTGEGSVPLESPAPNVEYAPLDMKTRSWEIARNNVKVEKIIGKGAFGQVAKGTATNLPLGLGASSVAIKMVKGMVNLFLLSFFLAQMIFLRCLRLLTFNYINITMDDSTTVEPRLSGLFDYPDFFSGPVFFMNVNKL